jgi:hypothetical protein
MRLSGQVFPAHQATHYSLAVGAIRTSVPCPPGYTLQPCSWGYHDKCSLPTRLHIADLQLGLLGQVFPAHQATHYWLSVGDIRTSVPCPPDYTLQTCSCGYQDKSSLPTRINITALRLGISGQVFLAHQTTHYRLVVGAIRTSVSLHITGLRLGLSGQVFPAHQATHYRLAVEAIRTSVPCPPGYTLQTCSWGYQDKCSLPTRLQMTSLQLRLSGQVFPA